MSNDGNDFSPHSHDLDSSEATPAGTRLRLTRLSDVKSEPVSWLWPGRFAIGKVTLVVGDPGKGKSLLTLDMAARVSRGDTWPDRQPERREPGGVLLLSAEDSLSDTVRPRLEAAGANMDRITAIEACVIDAGGKRRTFDLGRDLHALAERMSAVPNCRLVVIDPISAYLGKVDSNNNADVRGVLTLVSEFAERHRVAVVAVTHQNKSGEVRSIHRAIGSVGFIAAARAAWLVCEAPGDSERRLMLPLKNNLAPNEGGLAFTLERPEGFEQSAVCWEPDPVYVTADEAQLLWAGDSTPSKVELAAEWLRSHLSTGPAPAGSIMTAAKLAGHSEPAVRRASEALKLVKTKVGFDGGWEWSLPPDGDAETGDRVPVRA